MTKAVQNDFKRVKSILNIRLRRRNTEHTQLIEVSIGFTFLKTKINIEETETIQVYKKMTLSGI